MSEINSIANGTFTIGQTSATNFQAGPGIKIDSPSAGTVRIGSDETVLYSGTYNTATKSIVFSEPLSAFERIMVLWIHNNGTSTIYGTYDANGDAWFQHGGRFFNTGAGNCYDFITQWNIAANRLSANFYTDMINQPPTGYATKNGGFNELMPVKVIGINRKENA